MMYVSQIIILYTLNLYSAVCQLYFNKSGGKNVKYKNECEAGGRVVNKP